MDLSMEQKLESAKQLFENKQFDECKSVIFDIISTNEYKHVDRLYNKLGDICKQCKDYDNTQKHYQQAIILNPSNPALYFKLGSLFQYHLSDPNQADLMYQKCLNIDPRNDQCLFNYAYLMESQNKFSQAKKLYLQCIDINDQKACVHYRLAKIFQRENINTPQQAKIIQYLLQKACDLRPSFPKYQYQLALHLQKMGRYNLANHSYQNALRLLNYNDSKILHQYAKFLMDDMNDKQQAMKYMKMACALNDKLDCKELEDTFDGEDGEDDEELENMIKVVIYEFNSIITYWNMNAKVQRINQLNQWRSTDLVEIFGGYDRIERLQQVFHIVSLYNK